MTNSILLNTIATILDSCNQQKTFWLGFSGGLDSTVLLHALKQFSIKLYAIHVNHQIHPYANQWQQHCKKICKQFKIPFFSETITENLTEKNNLEARLRSHRYEIFAKYIQAGDYLVTAHQANDQAETLLMQLLRGSGLTGLTSMPEQKPFKHAIHLRPLLSLNRDVIHAYAIAHQLDWIEDEMNIDTHYDRNYLRHKIIPKLQQHWPATIENLLRSSQLLQSEKKLLQTYLQDDFNKVFNPERGTLKISILLQFPLEKIFALLRFWLNNLGFSYPSYKNLMRIYEEIITARQDAAPIVKYGVVIVRRYRDELFAIFDAAKKISTPHKSYVWNNLTQPLSLTEQNIELSAQSLQGQGIKIPKDKKVSVQFRRGGEICHLSKRGHRPLKKLMQEWHIPTWERDHIPLIYIDKQLAAVVGYADCEPFAAKQNELGLVVQVKKDTQR